MGIVLTVSLAAGEQEVSEGCLCNMYAQISKCFYLIISVFQRKHVDCVSAHSYVDTRTLKAPNPLPVLHHNPKACYFKAPPLLRSH